MKITDIHVHTVKKRIPIKNGNPMKPESHYIAEPDEIRRTLEAQGITHAVLMSGGESEAQTSHHLGAFNDDCQRICAEHPGFFSWMCNPDTGNPETVYERLSALKHAGAVGVGELMTNEWLDSPFLSAVFDAAERLSMPVLCHMSPKPGFSYGVCDHAGLPLLEQVLRNHPDLIYIGHSQTFWTEISSGTAQMTVHERNGFGKGPVLSGGRVEALMDQYPNLYADLSAYSGSCAVMRDRDYGIHFLNKFRDRLMFGTDTTNQYTVFPLLEYLKQLCADGKITEDTLRLIMEENAQRILGVTK